MSGTDDDKKPKSKEKWLLIALGGIFCIWVVFAVVMFVYNKYSFNEAGVFGDSFGAINALFSGLAFAAVFYALILQREDIDVQREELRLTREETKRQNFENTFFQMLRLHNDIVAGYEVRYLASPYKGELESGRKCFAYLSQQLQNLIETDEDHLLRHLTDDYFNAVEDTFSNYIKILFTIFELIIDEHKNANDRQRYTNIVFALLSKPEMQIFAYFLISERAKEYRTLIIELSLINYVKSDIFFKPEHKNIIADEIKKWSTDTPP